MADALLAKVRSVVELLAAGKYDDLEKLTDGRRLTSAEMALAVREYGRCLIAPPDDAYEELDVVQVQNRVPAEWSVWMPLWSKEEGRSDLTLQLTVREVDGDLLVELDDIHVL
jgi:hypothetical protein